ncbi:MAG TPA: bifunctional oligoribonuclease/PAP phosphatase NrnA [Thermodesulfobacteriaceae bacterium]|nr:bifunctional oligoribonuclease/PAP phosphatase NrnA [Thermodesulfobacteriaceae bacterium]
MQVSLKTDGIIVGEELKTVAGALDRSERCLITCHVKPDGDALGSMLGLALALMDQDKKVTLFSEDTVPETLRFLPGAHHISQELPARLHGGTTLVVLDCNEPQRLGRQARKMITQASTVIILDHHLFKGDFCLMESGCTRPCFSLIRPDIFATGAIVFQILKELQWPVSEEIAMNLYTAIVTDTGSFRHSNTTAHALQTAGELVSLGARPYLVADNLYQSYPLRRLKLLQMALSTLELTPDGKIGLLQATPEMFQSSGARERDTDDFVGYARCVDTVEVAVFLKEVSSGEVAVSLRSKSYFNVAEVARHFGGGGHFHAAGFRKKMGLQEVRKTLLDHLTESFSNMAEKAHD